MVQDRYGNEITSDCPETADAFDMYTEGFLSYGKTLPKIIEAADADRGCCAANAHAAAVHMAFEAASGFRKAEPYLERAQACAAHATERERCFVDAVSAWSVRDFPKTAAIFKDMAARWPEDLAAVKWGQYHCFNLGDQDGLLALGERLAQVHDGAPYVHGMQAFALEQAHRLDEAEEAGRRAVEIERADPWAHHAVAHVMETQGRVEDGLGWMYDMSETWDDKGFFIRLHNWWHVALFHLDLDDHAAALKVYDEHLEGLYPEFCQEQIGAISMLWRLELRGVDVGGRWQPLLGRVRERELEHLLPFHDLHYVYALARAGTCCDVDTFLYSMERHALRQDGVLYDIWREVAVPVAYGIAAHGQKRYEDAAELLRPRLEMLHRIGGSHAQRDIFVQTYIDAAIRAGRAEETVPMLKERFEARPNVPVTERLLRAATAA